MDRLIATNSVAFANRDVAPVSGTPQYATDGNPSTSTPPTIWPAYAWNMIQDEIRKVITDAGLTPDDTNWGQLSEAVQAMISGAAGSFATTSALAAEVTRAETAEAAEVTRAEGAESTLSTAISGETTRAEAAEATLVLLTHMGHQGGATTAGSGGLSVSDGATPPCNGILLINGAGASNGPISAPTIGITGGTILQGGTPNFWSNPSAGGSGCAYNATASVTAGTPFNVTAAFTATGTTSLSFTYVLIPIT